MERGINLGGAFDRRDGQPGWQVRPEVLDAIVAAGFSGVRLPVRWANARLAEVAEVVEAVVTRGLSVVVTNHHDDEAMTEGYAAAGRLAELWRALATEFLGFRGELAFELLNEPLMSAADWNRLLPAVLVSVREVDPDRSVVVGGADASSVAGLRQLELPADDRLVATVHYYDPFRFTHQGAGWLPGADGWLGATWGTAADREAVTTDLSEAFAWARDRGVPLYVGEFGAVAAADRASRLHWTAWVRHELERLGIPWAYWDLVTEFGAYDPARGAWDAELLDALLGS
jgi:endoglucanase